MHRLWCWRGIEEATKTMSPSMVSRSFFSVTSRTQKASGIQGRIQVHPKPFSSQTCISSKTTFIQYHFSSQNHFHPTPLSLKTTVSPKTTFSSHVFVGAGWGRPGWGGVLRVGVLWVGVVLLVGLAVTAVGAERWRPEWEGEEWWGPEK